MCVFCAVPWEESWLYLCNNVYALLSVVERELGVLLFVFLCDNVCVCVCVCVFCAVPWEESWLYLCDNVYALLSVVERELGVFT